ncbi:MAG: PBP1A family penicillin-binding protein [Deltaproteobacteria bacterium]|nr:PBP1A family penicillin-binding protein [Deltaproteobacteria bacterium]
MIRRHRLLFFALFVAAAGVVCAALRLGYLYVEVGKGIAEGDGGSPTIFYGRPLEISKGLHLGNAHVTERLNRLAYRRVAGKPSAPGTYAHDEKHFRIFLRRGKAEGGTDLSGPVEIGLQDGRVSTLTSDAGKELESIRLAPEEIGRIMSVKLDARHQVRLSDISPYLQDAVIASEDSHFYSHFGLDILAIGRAFITDVKEQRFAEGGSTITQQLAKNFFLSPRKTVARKLREAELAVALEFRYSKKQILEMYLNKIYLGQTGMDRIYGVEDAAGIYFSKHARDLSLEEAALLAGIIHAPNRYALLRNPGAARERRNKVLARMEKLDMIREAQFVSASAAPVQIRSGLAPVHLSSYFIDYIQRITKEEMGTERLYHTGYRYYTTLDPVQQGMAEEAVTRGLETIGKTARRAAEPLQAALVAIDPKTGAVTAMVGGRNYGQSRFNRAVDARRQPGSAFKPFVLLAALAQSLAGSGNWTLSTRISGEPIVLPTPEGMWSPSNFEDKQYGMLTIRKTIEDSVNTATTRLANDIGFPNVLDAARQAGIKSPLLPVPSMALGSFEVTPLELAYAYTTLAADGFRYDPFSLYSVTMADGEPIIERRLKRRQALDPRVTYLTSYALEGVLTRGTAKEARALNINFPVSGKTGTTNGNRDSWFVAYTPDIVCAVWVGYDSGADTGLTGAAGALRINARFLRAFYSQAGPRPLSAPPGIETALVDPESGYLATVLCPHTFREAYLAGTAPKETCPDHPVNPVMDAIRGKMHDVKEFLRGLFK